MIDPSLTPDRLARIQELFDAALEESPERRIEFVSQQAPDDPDLQAEVLSLLAVHDTAEDRLQSPISPSTLKAVDVAADRWTGVRLGPYEIGRRIGTGGMGTVYEAVRADDQYHQRVAIKLLRREVEGEAATRRLRNERQILANLNHPNIAGLLDGGTTPEGQPYIVMEFVDGTPIDQWADARRLSVPARIELLEQVCVAVQYAHQNLVIHRDLKPANILVTDDGTVKLLDFGIAKLLPEAGTMSEEIAQTRAGFRVFTPEYASPEQFRGRQVSTASDVYSLGVVLFELLVGRRPFELADRTIEEVEDAVTGSPPPRPSTVMGADRWQRLHERGPRQARGQITGDLDAIALMALRKEPERRYGTAAQLGQDLRRFLNGHPVTARPDGVGYRLRKFIRRRKWEVTAAVVAALSLSGGMIATSIEARRAEAEHDRSVQVTDFLTTMLGAADPAAFGRDVTVREVLDSAAVRAGSLGGTPALEGEIRAIIGGTYVALGEYEAAETQYRMSLDAHQRLAPEGDYATAVAMSRVAAALEYAGDLVAADSVLGEALKLLDRYPPPDHTARANFLDSRGRILARLGNAAEAAPLLREALDITRERNPPNDSALSYAYSNLAMATSEVGDNLGADSLYAAAIFAARNAYGDEHPLLASVMSAQATLFERLGQWERADSTLRAVTEMRRRLLGPEHPDYAWTVFNHADHLVRGGHFTEGAEKAREVLALRGRSLPDTHPAIAVAMQVLGRALGGMDSLTAGEYWIRESLELRRRTLPEGNWLIYSSESVLGEHLVLEGRYDQAEELLLPAEEKLVELRGEGTQVVNDVRARIVGLYTAWGRPDDAERWRARIVTP